MRTAHLSSALRAFIGLPVAVGLAGCVVVPPPRPYSPQQIAPTPRALTFHENLTCLGRLLDTYSDDTRPIVIGIVSAYDQTGVSDLTAAEVPRQFMAMLETAVASISPHIRIAHLDHAWLYGERVVGGDYARALPKVVLKASLSEFDRGLRQDSRRKDGSASFGNGKGATEISGNLSRDSAESNLVVDLSAIRYADQATIGGAVAAVEVKVRRTLQEQAWSIAVAGIGIGDSATTRYVEGRHAGLRAAAEAGAIKVIASALGLPYWRCGGIWSQPDAAMAARLKSAFRTAPVQQQFKALLEAVRPHDRNVKPEVEAVTVAARQIAARFTTGGDPCKAAAMDWTNLWWSAYVSVPTTMPGANPASATLSASRCNAASMWIPPTLPDPATTTPKAPGAKPTSPTGSTKRPTPQAAPPVGATTRRVPG